MNAFTKEKSVRLRAGVGFESVLVSRRNTLGYKYLVYCVITCNLGGNFSGWAEPVCAANLNCLSDGLLFFVFSPLNFTLTSGSKLPSRAGEEVGCQVPTSRVWPQSIWNVANVTEGLNSKFYFILMNLKVKGLMWPIAIGQWSSRELRLPFFPHCGVGNAFCF